MRILVVSNLYPPNVLGGYEIGCSQMVAELRLLGHSVHVLTSYSLAQPELDERDVERRLSLAPIYENELLGFTSEESRTQVRTRAHLLDATNLSVFASRIASFKPDLVYFWNLIGLGGWSLMLAAQKMNLPWVMHLMDNVPTSLCVYSHGVEPTLVSLWEQGFHGQYVSCSRRLLHEVVLTGPDISGACSIIPNWLSRDNLESSRDIRVRTEDGPLRLVFAGTVAAFKGVDIVIDMSRLLKERGVPHHVDVYGRVDQPELLDMAVSAGLSELMTFHGPVSHRTLIDHLGDYDIFVFPTWDREPMAFAPIEAMAFGCLVLITDVNGNAEWFVHGVHVWKAPRHARAMAAAVQTLAADPPLRRRIAAAGRALSHGQLAIDKQAARVERVMEEMVRGNPRRPIHDAAEAARISRIGNLAQQISMTQLTR